MTNQIRKEYIKTCRLILTDLALAHASAHEPAKRSLCLHRALRLAKFLYNDLSLDPEIEEAL